MIRLFQNYNKQNTFKTASVMISKLSTYLHNLFHLQRWIDNQKVTNSMDF